MLVSCKKNQVQPTEEEKFSQDIPIVITGSFNGTDPGLQGNLTYNFLGYGYDITDKYNDAHSVRAEIVDIPLFASGSNNRINLSRSTQGYWENFSGENATDLLGQLSNRFEETSGLNTFKGTIINSFNDPNTLNEKYVYGYYSNIAMRMRLMIIEDYKNTVSNFLTNIFAQDVNTLSAADLVKKYGTHMITGVELGSKLSVVYQAEAPKTDRKKISSTGLRYAMKSTFGLFTGELDPMDLKALNANVNARIYINAVGGDQSKLVLTKVNNRPIINLTEWYKTTTEEKAKFIGITTKGIVPLDQLIKDAVKREAVKAYLIKYIQDNEAKIQN